MHLFTRLCAHAQCHLSVLIICVCSLSRAGNQKAARVCEAGNRNGRYMLICISSSAFLLVLSSPSIVTRIHVSLLPLSSRVDIYRCVCRWRRAVRRTLHTWTSCRLPSILGNTTQKRRQRHSTPSRSPSAVRAAHALLCIMSACLLVCSIYVIK